VEVGRSMVTWSGKAWESEGMQGGAGGGGWERERAGSAEGGAGKKERKDRDRGVSWCKG